VGAFYAWHRAMRGTKALWAALSALCVLCGLLWSLSLLAAAALLGAATLLEVWREAQDGSSVCEQPEGVASSVVRRLRQLSWQPWIRIAVAWVVTFVIVSLLPRLFFGYHTWQVWRTSFSQHAGFSTLFSRSYLPWVLFNPVDYALFTGVPVFLLLIAATFQDARRWLRGRPRPAPALLPWALLLVLTALNFSGKNLGEVGRLWMFLMPFGALAGAPCLVRLDARRGWPAAVVVLLMLAQLVTFRLTLDVLTHATG
jgi:hypothetical protein